MTGYSREAGGLGTLPSEGCGWWWRAKNRLGVELAEAMPEGSAEGQRQGSHTAGWGLGHGAYTGACGQKRLAPPQPRSLTMPASLLSTPGPRQNAKEPESGPCPSRQSVSEMGLPRPPCPTTLPVAPPGAASRWIPGHCSSIRWEQDKCSLSSLVFSCKARGFF